MSSRVPSFVSALKEWTRSAGLTFGCPSSSMRSVSQRMMSVSSVALAISTSLRASRWRMVSSEGKA